MSCERSSAAARSRRAAAFLLLALTLATLPGTHAFASPLDCGPSLELPFPKYRQNLAWVGVTAREFSEVDRIAPLIRGNVRLFALVKKHLNGDAEANALAVAKSVAVQVSDGRLTNEHQLAEAILVEIGYRAFLQDVDSPDVIRQERAGEWLMAAILEKGSYGFRNVTPDERLDLVGDSAVAFMRKFRKDGFNDSYHFAGALNRIASNAHLMKIRSSHRPTNDSRKTTSLDTPLDTALGGNTLGDTFADQSPSAYSQLLGKEMRQRLRKVLESTPGYLRVFEMRVFGDADFAEIARAMGIQEATARSQFYKARKKVVKELGIEVPEPTAQKGASVASRPATAQGLEASPYEGAIDLLSGTMKTIASYHYRRGFSPEQIAERLNRDVDAVRADLARLELELPQMVSESGGLTGYVPTFKSAAVEAPPASEPKLELKPELKPEPIANNIRTAEFIEIESRLAKSGRTLEEAISLISDPELQKYARWRYIERLTYFRMEKLSSGKTLHQIGRSVDAAERALLDTVIAPDGRLRSPAETRVLEPLPYQIALDPPLKARIEQSPALVPEAIERLSDPRIRDVARRILLGKQEIGVTAKALGVSSSTVSKYFSLAQKELVQLISEGGELTSSLKTGNALAKRRVPSEIPARLAKSGSSLADAIALISDAELRDLTGAAYLKGQSLSEYSTLHADRFSLSRASKLLNRADEELLRIISPEGVLRTSDELRALTPLALKVRMSPPLSKFITDSPAKLAGAIRNIEDARIRLVAERILLDKASFTKLGSELGISRELASKLFMEADRRLVDVFSGKREVAGSKSHSETKAPLSPSRKLGFEVPEALARHLDRGDGSFEAGVRALSDERMRVIARSRYLEGKRYKDLDAEFKRQASASTYQRLLHAANEELAARLEGTYSAPKLTPPKQSEALKVPEALTRKLGANVTELPTLVAEIRDPNWRQSAELAWLEKKPLAEIAKLTGARPESIYGFLKLAARSILERIDGDGKIGPIPLKMPLPARLRELQYADRKRLANAVALLSDSKMRAVTNDAWVSAYAHVEVARRNGVNGRNVYDILRQAESLLVRMVGPDGKIRRVIESRQVSAALRDAMGDSLDRLKLGISRLADERLRAIATQAFVEGQSNVEIGRSLKMDRHDLPRLLKEAESGLLNPR